tara:strand:+ start:305 stop:1231 length:927 start_codon:yes stop_codon:yes gene_type:complete
MSLSNSKSSSLLIKSISETNTETDTDTKSESETETETETTSKTESKSETTSTPKSESPSVSALDKEIDDFYKLKAKYNERLSKIKQKIKNKETLTKKDKQMEFKNTQFKCINCNKPGGTLFEIKNNKLRAICGASNKCDLNINIDKSTYYNIRDEKTNVEEQIDLIKTDIIKTKLDFLFNYIEESEVIKEFNIQKEDLNIFSKGLVVTKKDYIEIVDNIEKNNSLKESIIALHEKIIQIKDLEKNYIETKNTQLIEDIINIYKIDIIPLNKKIRDLKYSYYNIVKDEDENNIIIKTPYTLDKLFLQNY